jgi:hypothetical protein
MGGHELLGSMRHWQNKRSVVLGMLATKIFNAALLLNAM